MTELYRLTGESFRWLKDNVDDNLKYYKDPDSRFEDLLKRQFPGGFCVPVSGVSVVTAPSLEAVESGSPWEADVQALDFHRNLEGMTPHLASDPRIFAYLNHVHLHKYGTLRWPSRNHDTKKILRHWLSEDYRHVYESSISGRTWWIAHVANVAETHSGGAFSAEDVIRVFACTPDLYHRTMQYSVLRNPVTMAECVRSLLNEARGINRDGYREIARDVNRQGGARLIDSLSRQSLRDVILRSATQKMSVPEFVSDRENLTNKKKLRVLSLGAGAQSTVMALMAEDGWDGLEKPDLAIFADTGWEPPNVYEHLDWLERQLSYEVIRVSAGNIRENILNGVNSTGQKFLDVPVFLVNRDGTKSVAARQCTAHYKIVPIVRELRRRFGIPAGRRAPKDVEVEMWMGISTDEATRMKPNRAEWITNRYPLIEMDMSRANLYNWFHDRYPDRHLPRSACVGCPYHSDMEWKWLKENSPESFQDAVHVDWALRNVPKAKGTIKGTAFLHHGRVPLDAVDFKETEDYDSFMTGECEGLCGV